MFKKRFLALATSVFLLSSYVMSSTLDEANRLYAKRGEDKQFAADAANIYKQLATQSRNDEQKSELLILEAQAVYFVGYKMPNNPKDPKLEVFERGYEAADQALKLAEKLEDKTQMAKALYWYGANLGKWGETNGVLASLRKWPELKEKSLRIRELDPSVYEYGANRILGRAFFKIPFESDEEGLEFYREAYEKTLVTLDNGLSVSNNPINNVYYLEGLMDRNEGAAFCGVYDNFADFLFEGEELWQEVTPEYIPETYDEQEKFDTNDELLDFYFENC